MVYMKKILLIASYDSFLYAGLEVARKIKNADIEIKIRTTVSNQLSQTQLNKIFHDQSYSYSSFFLNNYKDIDFNHYDIIILSVSNTFISSFFEFFFSSETINRKQIVTLSLFAGVIFGEINSITSRINSDILLLNNYSDYILSKKIKQHWKLNTKLIHYGFPVIQRYTKNNDDNQNIYFFEQVKIPETYSDRVYLLKKLIEYAKKNPETNIYIKPRVSIKEKTVHENKYPLEILLKKNFDKKTLPNNLLFSYESVADCFKNAKLVITISSTVAFEAIYNKIPVAIISDYGLRNEFANQEFLESGCLMTFEELNHKVPSVNKKWYDEMVAFPENRIEVLNQIIENSVKEKKLHEEINYSIATQDLNYIKEKSKYKNYSLKKSLIFVINKPKTITSISWNFIIKTFSLRK